MEVESDMAKSDLKKAAALAALAESSTLTEAAEKAGISRRTLYEYIRNDIEFSVAYKSLQEQTTLQAYDAAAARRAHASEVVEAIMDDAQQPGAVRLKAALSIIDKADKLEAEVSGLASSHVRANHNFFEDPFAPAPH